MENFPESIPNERDEATPITPGQEPGPEDLNNPGADNVEREEDDKELLPDEEDDFSETYGDLDGAQETEIVPQPDEQAGITRQQALGVN